MSAARLRQHRCPGSHRTTAPAARHIAARRCWCPPAADRQRHRLPLHAGRAPPPRRPHRTPYPGRASTRRTTLRRSRAPQAARLSPRSAQRHRPSPPAASRRRLPWTAARACQRRTAAAQRAPPPTTARMAAAAAGRPSTARRAELRRHSVAQGTTHWGWRPQTCPRVPSSTHWGCWRLQKRRLLAWLADWGSLGRAALGTIGEESWACTNLKRWLGIVFVLGGGSAC
eukprot:364326-Chlamydomonas_euryale.AAC.4